MKILIFLSLLFEGTITCSLHHPVENQENSIVSCDLNLVDENLRPAANQDQIKFYAWNQLGVKHIELKIGNDSQLGEFIGIRARIEFFIYFHDIEGNGLEKWIQDNKENFLYTSRNKIASISVDYQALVLNKRQAIRNLEPIANRTAELLSWITSLFHERSLFLELVGHGFGAIIAASVAEIITRYNNVSYWPNIFTALDPEIIDDQDPNLLEVLKSCKKIKIPQIREGLGDAVYVLHTSTCSHIPLIPACNSKTTDTIGYCDLYPNGGGTQPGCLLTDSSCSRKRATDIFVESNAASIYGSTKFYVSQCSNFSEFQKGACNLCDLRPCYEMNIYYNGVAKGRFYFYTNSASPYARGYDVTPP